MNETTSRHPVVPQKPKATPQRTASQESAAPAGHLPDAAVHLPDPTPWPMVLGLGISLAAAGLIIDPLRNTGLLVIALGVVVFIVALARLIQEDVALYERRQ